MQGESKLHVKLCTVYTNNDASFHLWWKENLVKHYKVSKKYDHDCSKLPKSEAAIQRCS